MDTTRDQAPATPRSPGNPGTPGAPRLGRYEIDTGSSTVSFRTRHLFGLAPVRGTFAVRAGTVDVAEPLSGSRIYAEVEAASFRTRSRQRDRNVGSAAFLDTHAFPVMTFRSGRIAGPDLTGAASRPGRGPGAGTGASTGTGIVAGLLTVRDVTRPVSLTVRQTSVSRDSFTVRASTRIDRFEFGVTASRGLAGRYLDLTLEVRCVRR
jgi:polyisoprenoid-binding protein YceI